MIFRSNRTEFRARAWATALLAGMAWTFPAKADAESACPCFTAGLIDAVFWEFRDVLSGAGPGTADDVATCTLNEHGSGSVNLVLADGGPSGQASPNKPETILFAGVEKSTEDGPPVNRPYVCGFLAGKYSHASMAANLTGKKAPSPQSVPTELNVDQVAACRAEIFNSFAGRHLCREKN